MSGISSQEDEDKVELSSIDYDTLNPSAAKLAENKDEFLDAIHNTDDHRKRTELAEWIGGILGEFLKPEILFDDLNNGVRLLFLAKSIHLIKCSHLKDSEYMDTVKNLQPDEFDFTVHGPPKRASYIAKQRSNIIKFLEWCRLIGVPPITLFETEDLAQEKNLRQVTTCLFYVSRIAANFGIEPPSSVKEEMKNEEAKLLGKKLEESLASSRRSPTSDAKRLILDKPTIFEEDEYALPPMTKMQDFELNTAENFERTSTPSSTHSFVKSSQLESYIKPISPMELKFEQDDDSDAVVVETLGSGEKLHFEKQPFIEDVEIRETPDMVIVDELQFRPVDVPVDHEITKFDDGTEVRVSPAAPDINENTNAVLSDSTYDTATTDENEYHTAHVSMSDDIHGLMYHTAFVDDVSDDDEELENMDLENSRTYERIEEPVDVPEPAMSSYEEIPDINDIAETLPFSLYRVPADIVVEKHDSESESCDESATDVESYVSDDERRDITYVDIGVGTDDLDDLKNADDKKHVEKEIMIDFPPYFEFSTKSEFSILPQREYIIAPARNDPVYSAPKKSSSRQREARTNTAYEADQERAPRPHRDYSSSEPRQPRRHRQHTPPPEAATLPMPYKRHVFVDPHNEKGTQTHVSLTQDIVRIINELEDIPRIRTTSSSVSSGLATTPPDPRPGTTVVVRTQYERTLPTSDRDVAITQVTDLQSSRPPRWGSVSSSTRHRSRDPETASSTADKEVRRSIIRRASSLISEQFEKAAVIAKKYQKQIIIILVLLILTAGALAAMLAVFPLT